MPPVSSTRRDNRVLNPCYAESKMHRQMSILSSSSCGHLPKVCPLLLRVFPRRGGHHRLEEFQRRGEEPEGELTMYTWPDATLRELTDLVKEVPPCCMGTFWPEAAVLHTVKRRAGTSERRCTGHESRCLSR